MSKEENREGYARRVAAGDGVKSEPRLYGPANPELSYWEDLGFSVTSEPGSSDARDRQARHAQEVAADAAIGRPYASRGLRGVNRRERRAMNSGAASGGSFVSPEWMTDKYALYRSAEASFVNQTTNLPLPEYGLTIDVPSFTSTTNVAQQATENSGVSEGDPTGIAISAPLVTIAGQVNLSQQLQDRGGMTGLVFDEIIGKQLMSQYVAAADVYVINQATANAGVITDATSYTTALFYQDLAKATEILTDTAGVRLRPTHMFTTSDLFGFVTRQLDSEGRPLLLPDVSALMAAEGDPDWGSWTAVAMPGALRWFVDDNIPAVGNNTQILVCRPQEIYTFDGDHYSYAYPETNANTLSVLVGLRGYVGVIVRFNKAIAQISGATYPLTLV